MTPILITGGGVLTALLFLRQTGQRPAPPPIQPFTTENLTERFISAIPELTQELNLELATATFNETFTKQSDRTTCWGLMDLFVLWNLKAPRMDAETVLPYKFVANLSKLETYK